MSEAQCTNGRSPHALVPIAVVFLFRYIENPGRHTGHDSTGQRARRQGQEAPSGDVARRRASSSRAGAGARPRCSGCRHDLNFHGGAHPAACQAKYCRCEGWAAKRWHVRCRGCRHLASFHVADGPCQVHGRCPCQRLHAKAPEGGEEPLAASGTPPAA